MELMNRIYYGDSSELRQIKFKVQTKLKSELCLRVELSLSSQIKFSIVHSVQNISLLRD